MNYLISEVPYFQTPNDIFTTDLSNNEKLVYIYLSRCANNGKVAFPSYQTIADNCSISKATAIRCIKVLTERCFVYKEYRIKEDGENYSNIYRVNYNIGSIMMTPPSIMNTLPSITVTPNKELPIKNKLEKNKFLHHSDRMTNELLILLNDYSINRFGKGIRKHKASDYDIEYLVDVVEEIGFNESMDFYISKYDHCNLEYLTTIEERIK